MGTGDIQLVSYGEEDKYIMGNPQITFFKSVYRKHTNFAIESIKQEFSGTIGFGQRVGCTLAKNGDLIHKIYLEVDINKFSLPISPKVHLGHALIKDVNIEIGGQEIDKHYSQWLQVWNELSNPDYNNTVVTTTPTTNIYVKDTDSDKTDIYWSKSQIALGTTIDRVIQLEGQVNDSISQGVEVAYADCGYRRMVGDMGYNLIPSNKLEEANGIKLYIPLQFWFCRNPGLALPLIALQYHDVEINVTIEDSKNLFGETEYDIIPSDSDLDIVMWVDYIFVDENERKRFAKMKHEYLIEQVQFSGEQLMRSGSINKYYLNFNHPVKEIIWATNVNSEDEAIVKNASNITQFGPKYKNLSCHFSRLSNGREKDATVHLEMDGHARFTKRNMSYFTRVQPHQHHTNIPLNDRIGTYSFALDPEEHQPTGTCNFSRIESTVMTFDFTNQNATDIDYSTLEDKKAIYRELTYSNNQEPGISTGTSNTINAKSNIGKVFIFATNYNILKIMSGMGGLMYSN